MTLNKILRIKVVIAVAYSVTSFFSNGFGKRLWDYDGNFDFGSGAWFGLFIPLALLFSTDIWRWIKSGSDW